MEFDTTTNSFVLDSYDAGRILTERKAFDVTESELLLEIVKQSRQFWLDNAEGVCNRNPSLCATMLEINRHHAKYYKGIFTIIIDHGDFSQAES